MRCLHELSRQQLSAATTTLSLRNRKGEREALTDCLTSFQGLLVFAEDCFASPGADIYP